MQKQQIEYKVEINGEPDFTQIPDKVMDPFIDELLVGLKKYLSEQADKNVAPQT